MTGSVGACGNRSSEILQRRADRSPQTRLEHEGEVDHGVGLGVDRTRLGGCSKLPS